MALLFLGVIVIIQLIETCVCATPFEVSGIRIPPVGRGSFARATNPTCGTSIGAVCADDCKTLMTCVGDAEPLWHQGCNEISSNTPYCVGSICTNQLPSTGKCAQGPSTFKCTSEGIFPDASDCTVYHYCSDVHAVAENFKCPDGYNFFASTKLCRKLGPCQKLNCANKLNKWVQYDAAKGYYGFCSQPPVMFKCPDEDTSIFDLTTNKCVYNCVAAGDFPDPDDCTKYITCERVGAKFSVIGQKCPIGYYFDKTKCIRGDCQPQPTTQPTTLTTN